MEDDVFSIWEKDSFLKYDYIIIGGGITGISTALSLKEKQPKADILILERGYIPTGASTKNAGFACFGSYTEILDDINNFGKDHALQLVEDRVNGLELLRKRINDKAMEYHNNGGYELVLNNHLPLLEHLDELNKDMLSIFNEPAFSDVSSSIKKFGFYGIKSMLYTPFEGQLNSGKLIRALKQKAAQSGINFIAGANVTELEDKKDKVNIFVESAREAFMFEASKVVVCTNAYTKLFFPKIDLSPGRGIILITKPVKNLLLSGSFHFDRGYYYFRNYNNRILFGGGRNIDFESETTTEQGINSIVLKGLKSRLQKIIIPHEQVEVEKIWSGIMAFGKTKNPIIKLHTSNIALAVRFGGMGIALGSLAGQKVARLLTDQQ